MLRRLAVFIVATAAAGAFIAFGCGGGAETPVTPADQGGTGAQGVAKNLGSIPSLDLSDLEEEAEANLAAKPKVISTAKGFMEIGSSSIMGCQLNMMKEQMYDMSKIFQGSLCFNQAVQENAVVEIPEDAWTYFQFQPFEVPDVPDELAQEGFGIGEEGEFELPEGWEFEDGQLAPPEDFSDILDDCVGPPEEGGTTPTWNPDQEVGCPDAPPDWLAGEEGEFEPPDWMGFEEGTGEIDLPAWAEEGETKEGLEEMFGQLEEKPTNLLFGVFKVRVGVFAGADGSYTLKMDQCIGSRHTNQIRLSVKDVTDDNNGDKGAVTYDISDCTASAYTTGCADNPQYLSLSGTAVMDMPFDNFGDAGENKGKMAITDYIVVDKCTCSTGGDRSFRSVGGTFAGNMISFFGRGTMQLIAAGVNTTSPVFKLISGFTQDTSGMTAVADFATMGNMYGTHRIGGAWAGTAGCGEFSSDSWWPAGNVFGVGVKCPVFTEFVEGMDDPTEFDPISAFEDALDGIDTDGDGVGDIDPTGKYCHDVFGDTEAFAIATAGDGTKTFTIADETGDPYKSFCDARPTLPTGAITVDVVFEEAWDCEPETGKTFTAITESLGDAMEACADEYFVQPDEMTDCFGEMRDTLSEDMQGGTTDYIPGGGGGEFPFDGGYLASGGTEDSICQNFNTLTLNFAFSFPEPPEPPTVTWTLPVVPGFSEEGSLWVLYDSMSMDFVGVQLGEDVTVDLFIDGAMDNPATLNATVLVSGQEPCTLTLTRSAE